MLQHVALGIKAKMLGRRLVTPFNPTLGIKQHHAIGGRLQRRQKLIETGLAFFELLLPLFQQPPGSGGNFMPNPG